MIQSVAALFGGLAIGAVLAAVLPATRREAHLLGDAGSGSTRQIRDGVKSAKQSGLGKLDEFGVKTFKDKLGELAGSAQEVTQPIATRRSGFVTGYGPRAARVLRS